MEYNKIFDPDKVVPKQSTENIENFGDRNSKSVYVYNENTVLAVNVAIATGRPLLVRGPSGWGKSSLARSIAQTLGWRYYEKVISSRIQARDLLWEVDLIRRLQDAHMKQLEDISYYIRPGVLWKAFDFDSANEQEKKALSLSMKVSSKTQEQSCRNNDPQDIKQEDFKSAGIVSSQKKDYIYQAVVLLDEIDKADLDFPNNLLVPLGSLYFTIDETGLEVKCKKTPLVIITTNDERDLPPAFLRRCVELQLSKPNFLEVGKAHFGEEHLDLVTKLANLMESFESKHSLEQFTMESSSPSPAEFIDAVNACINLKIESPETVIWDMIKRITIWKHGRKERG